jgi:hypothetical protein
MAKKGVARKTEPQELRREVQSILTTAGWKVREQHDGHRRFGVDILASARTDLYTERRCAIELVLEINQRNIQDSYSRYLNWLGKRGFTEFDEFWLVGYDYTAGSDGDSNDRHFRILDLNALRAVVASTRRGTKGKARTKIGKAVEANEKEINLAIAGLILQVDAKIEALQGERPNSDEAIADRNAHITDYERMRNELERLRIMVAAFMNGTGKEGNVVRSLKTFADGLGLWWDKGHDTILARTFDMGLFTTAVGICSMAGAGGKMAVAVSAVLVGGKPVAQALKGLIPKRFMAD